MFLIGYQIDDTILNAIKLVDIKLVDSNLVDIIFKFRYLQYSTIGRVSIYHLKLVITNLNYDIIHR